MIEQIKRKSFYERERKMRKYSRMLEFRAKRKIVLRIYFEI